MRRTATPRLVAAAALCALPLLGLAPVQAAPGQLATGPTATSRLSEGEQRYTGAKIQDLEVGTPDDPAEVGEGAYLTTLPKGRANKVAEHAVVYTMKDPKATLRVSMLTLKASGGWLTLKSMDGGYCGVSVNSMQFGQLLTTMAATSEDSVGCGNEDQYLIVLENYTDDELMTRLQIVEEPVETDDGWGDAIRMPTAPPPTSNDPTPITGGDDLDVLPLLEDGSYTLSLASDEQQWFAVPLHYGEGINLKATFRPVSSPEDRILVPPFAAVEVYDPMMLGYATLDGREMLDTDADVEVPVKVPALGSSSIDDTRDIGPHLPGVYRVAVSLEEYAGDEVEVQLDVERYGEAEADPTYKGGDWSYDEAVGLTWNGTGDPMARDGSEPSPSPTQTPDDSSDDSSDDTDASAASEDGGLDTRQAAGGLSAAVGVALLAAGGVLLARRRSAGA